MPNMQQERRAESRFPLFLPATVRAGAGASRVQLRNLSCSGAQAESLRPPPQGSNVTLTRDQLIVEARVAWVSGMRFGLSFADPIGANDLLVQLGRGREAPRQRPS